MRLPLQWKVLIGYLVVAGLGMGTAGWLALDALEASDLDQLREGLTAQARIAARVFVGPLGTAKPDTSVIDALADDLGNAIHARLTLINPEGLVLGDSYESGEALRRMDNHSTRPEVRQAVTDGVGSSIRYSDTIGTRLLYLALPIRSGGPNGHLLGFVRVALPLKEIEARHRALRSLLVAALGGAFLLSLGLSYVVARSVTHPLSEMVVAARRMARGEFREKIHTHSNDEIADLAAVLNHMATAIEETIQTLKDDRAKMAATLTAMQEGVIVLASDGTVRLINPAMERMVGRRETEVLGRTYLEVIRQPHLNEFITEALTQSTVSSTEIVFGTGPERTFQVQASPLAQWTDPSPGLVLVFHDITELRRLEQIRKDFVANVSHELRTPLTAIKGYIEALQDGGVEEREQRARFLETIRKQTDRLNLIITDLLLLAKIESGQVPLKQEPVGLAGLIDRTVGLLKHLIEQKQHRVVVKIPTELPPILGDEERLGQVFTNLLDNAIKYTPDQGTITISAELTSTEPPTMIEVCVADTGIGIPPQDLPRIFERFYRVDKARSRELGGTGLGLSIVKHLVEGHSGTVSAESQGKGSRFLVRLPIATSAALTT
ncbi:MAG TPA: ATP-binding protein [Nitrospirales bacterium]|nr:ATP-binding protein [Nitrospirales bacterium]